MSLFNFLLLLFFETEQLLFFLTAKLTGNKLDQIQLRHFCIIESHRVFVAVVLSGSVNMGAAVS